MIYSFEGNGLCEQESMIEALGLGRLPVKPRRPVVSVVGSGGKTTLLHKLADEYNALGTAVIVTTTTHIWKEKSPFFLENPSSTEEILTCMTMYGQVWAGTSYTGGKLASLSPEIWSELLKEDFPILIEADGSRQMPIKVPAVHEPVIVPCSTHVLYVCGLDCVGKKIKEVVFRSELAAKMLNKTTEDLITTDDIAMLASSKQAGRKGCPKDARYAVVLNKADNEERIRDAFDICKKIRQKGIRRVLVTSLKK